MEAGRSAAQRFLGEAVGQLYVARHWTPDTERQANEVVEDLRAAYGDLISHASWMDEPTRKEALAKLAAFDPRLGHPVKYIDYSTMDVSRTDPLANDIASDRFQWNLETLAPSQASRPDLVGDDATDGERLLRPGAEPDDLPRRDPAAALFRPRRRSGRQLWRDGATIGHEMGHGFDDEGRQFDAKGELRDWWTKQPRPVQGPRRHARKQFDAYEPIPGVHIKGELTLGENLADLGGIEAAYAAYRRYVARHGEPPVIDGFTGDQRFFIAYAAAGKASRAKARFGRSCCRTRTARTNIGSTASSAISTPGTPPSTSSPATSCTCRPSSACTSGRRLGKAALPG